MADKTRISAAVSRITKELTRGVNHGREVLNQHIDDRKKQLIAESAAEARRQIQTQGRTALARFTRQMAGKALTRLGFLVGLVILRATAIVPNDLFFVAASAGLATFFVIDLYRSWPTLSRAGAELRRHHWRPKTALSEWIAASVFDQVMSRAEDYPVGRTQKLLLLVAGTKPEGLAAEIANAVADIARKTSWDDMRPYIQLATVNVVTFWIFYSAAALLITSTR